MNIARIYDLDWKVLDWIQTSLKCSFLDSSTPVVSYLGDFGAIWILCAIIMILSGQYRKQGFILLLGLAMGVLVGNLLLKNLIARPRPCWINATKELLVAMPKDYSFPSGHTLASVIAATILAYANEKFEIPAGLLAFLISFSRLYLYVHFPTDVIAATALGMLIGKLAITMGQFLP